jgi:deoxycytidylate deaminase
MKLEKVYQKLIDTLSPTIDSTKKYWVIAASLDHHNNIISIGENSYQKTHPMQSRLAIKTGNRTKEYLHAEIASLVKNNKKPESIVIIRMINNGKVKMAKPCQVCMLAIKEAKIKYIYYTNDNSEIIKEKI